MAFPEDYKVAKNVEVIYDETTDNHFLRKTIGSTEWALQVNDCNNFIDEAKISFDFNGFGSLSNSYHFPLYLFGSGYVDGNVVADSLYYLYIFDSNDGWYYEFRRSSDDTVYYEGNFANSSPTGFVNFSIEWWKENNGYWVALRLKGEKKYEKSISPTKFGWWFGTDNAAGGWRLDNIKVYKRWI